MTTPTATQVLDPVRFEAPLANPSPNGLYPVCLLYTSPSPRD